MWGAMTDIIIISSVWLELTTNAILFARLSALVTRLQLSQVDIPDMESRLEL